jgi:hypothetical protein
VEAPEKSVGSVMFVPVLGSGGDCTSLLECTESCTRVDSESEESCPLKDGEGGRHKAHSSGRTWVQRTVLGPCASQKCVSASYANISCFILATTKSGAW